MVRYLKLSAFGALCGAALFAAPFGAAAFSGGADSSPASVSEIPAIQQVAATAPAGKRCVKWTRRWNNRHGFGHRRCVQWR